MMAPAAATIPAVPYLPVTETISMTWAMLSMPMGIRPMTPGIANCSAAGVLSTSVYRPKPLPPCRGSVTAVMYSTLGADRTTGKLQFDASTVVRFEPGGPADAGPGGAGAVAFPARTAVAGRD